MREGNVEPRQGRFSRMITFLGDWMDTVGVPSSEREIYLENKRALKSIDERYALYQKNLLSKAKKERSQSSSEDSKIDAGLKQEIIVWWIEEFRKQPVIIQETLISSFQRTVQEDYRRFGKTGNVEYRDQGELSFRIASALVNERDKAITSRTS